MQSSLHIGRAGSLSLNLNYTWLLASVLMLWWLGLLWLPANFPDNSSLFYWAGAVIVLVLYFLSVLLHELVHTSVGNTGPRNVNLFPFGAGMPVGINRPEPIRTLISVLLAPLFNITLGLILLSIGSSNPDFLSAVATPLGWLNIALGVINLIPGTPFDGGWALRSLVTLFTDDYESGARIARVLGSVASLAFVIGGAWVGLTSNSWLLALALVLVGWAAREASATGTQRRMLRSMFDQIQASSIMEPVEPDDTVPEGFTVAEMAHTHRNIPPNVPLPVIGRDTRLLGLITLAQANRILQGEWSTTPVTALMTPLEQAHALPPYASLSQVLDIAHRLPDPEGDEEEAYIPIVDGGRLLGSINPGRLQAYEEIESAFGLQSMKDPVLMSDRAWSRALRFVPVLMGIAFVAVLGSMALHTNPAEPVTIAPGSSTIKFSNFSPADGAIVGTNANQLSLQAVAASPLTTITVKLDGDTLPSNVDASSLLTQTISAALPSLTQGVHNVQVLAETENGKSRSASWQFHVNLQGIAADGKPVGQAEPDSQEVQIVQFGPATGARVLADDKEVPIRLLVSAADAPKVAALYVDNQEVEGKITPLDGAQGQYVVTGSAPAVHEGDHTVRVEISQPTGNHYSTQWFFSASKPDGSDVYFKQTGYFLTQPFLDYWNAHGGLAIFGYPISYRLQETDKATGEVYTAQYFQRARFELHPATGDTVVLGRLGALMHSPEAGTQPKGGSQFFKETGHNLSGPFLTYWKAHGGLGVFGYPISEERTEISPTDGKEYRVQYFERNRFEYHPEKAGTPTEVQLGLLGTQLYQQKYK